jgi:hypothetical protein
MGINHDQRDAAGQQPCFDPLVQGKSIPTGCDGPQDDQLRVPCLHDLLGLVPVAGDEDLAAPFFKFLPQIYRKTIVLIHNKNITIHSMTPPFLEFFIRSSLRFSPPVLTR